MKHFILTLLAGGLASFSLSGAPVGWGGHYYEFVPSVGIDWPSAQMAAASSTYGGFGGHLATITSESENIFVASLVDGVVSYPGDPALDSVLEAWVGGFQVPADELDPFKGWKWLNGEGDIPIMNAFSPFANWFTGEPNDWLGAGTEQYMGIWGNDGYGNTIGSWNDEGGLWNISGYLVEYEASSVPEAGSSAAFMSLALLVICGASRRYASGAVCR